MAGRVGRVHKINGVDEASSEHESPEAINDSAGKVWIVSGERLSEGFASREFRHGKIRQVFVKSFALFEFPEPLLGRAYGIEFRGIIGLFPPSFGDDFVGVENELRLVRFTFEVSEFVVATAGAFGDAGPFGRLNIETAVKEGDKPPVMTLLNLGRDRMVVTLGALDLFAKEGPGDAGGDLAVIVALIVNEP